MGSRLNYCLQSHLLDNTIFCAQMNVCLTFQDIVESCLADEWCFLDGTWHLYWYIIFDCFLHKFTKSTPHKVLWFFRLVKAFSHFLVLSENELLMGISSKYLEFLWTFNGDFLKIFKISFVIALISMCG